MLPSQNKTRPNGMRVESKDQNGNIVIDYIGDLETNREARIYDAKQWCGQAILNHFPEYQQANAALGLYDDVRVNLIKQGIGAFRERCNQIEDNLNAATTLEEIWDVVIDFSGVVE